MIHFENIQKIRVLDILLLGGLFFCLQNFVIGFVQFQNTNYHFTIRVIVDS